MAVQAVDHGAFTAVVVVVATALFYTELEVAVALEAPSINPGPADRAAAMVKQGEGLPPMAEQAAIGAAAAAEQLMVKISVAVPVMAVL
jgi:hypothetical protein